jgi:hypothetical protein
MHRNLSSGDCLLHIFSTKCVQKFSSFSDAVRYVKQILQQIMDSIRITNIDRYITDAERILESIRTRNFSAEDASADMELELAKACE